MKPILYELEIRAYIGEEDLWGKNSFTFDGYIKIHFQCVNPTKRIVFHSVDLKFKKIELTAYDDFGIELVNRSAEDDFVRSFTIVTLNRECQKDMNYSLNINYTGHLADDLSGFYKSSYVDKKGNKN